MRLHKVSDKYFSNAWELYNDSFPIEERRLISHQEDILNLDYYHFEMIFNENDIIGIILWWNFENLKFIEHLAVQPLFRGKGLGKKILENFILQNSKPILLEVELPTNKINQKRIQFYQKLGFILNQHPYFQPPMRLGSPKVKLNLMSFPDAISTRELNDFISIFHPMIYR